MTKFPDDESLIEHLQHLDFASESGSLADTVYKHVQSKKKTVMTKRITRVAFSAAVLLTLVIVGMLASPNVRVFAQEIVAQVGNIRFTNTSGASVVIEGVPGTANLPTETDGETGKTIEVVTSTGETVSVTVTDMSAPMPLDTIEAAQAIYGNPIYHLPSVPDDLNTPPTYRVFAPIAVTTYTVAESADGYVRFSQMNSAESGLRFDLPSGAQVEQIPLRGTTALFTTEPASGVHTLAWEENGYTFMLRSNIYDRGRLIALAADLTE